MNTVLIVGCGFVGEAAADLFHAAGWEVTGWTRSAASAERLSAVKPYPVASQDACAGALPRVDPAVVVDCVSSGRGGAEAYRRVYLEGARALRAAFPGARLIFTSSTSVYAQTDGSWVDEGSAAEPERETGRILRETEDEVLAAGGAVLRLAGLYGPGRSTLLAKARAGETGVEGDGLRWMNFCHRDDAARAIAAAVDRGVTGLLNVADDCPVQQGDCVRALAEMYGRPAPPGVPADLDRKRGWTSKRVRNDQLRAVGWAAAHPSFLEWARAEIAREPVQPG